MTADFRVHGLAAARRRPRGKQRNGPVTTTRVHDDVWSLALILAGHQRERLRVLSAWSVLVVNR